MAPLQALSPALVAAWGAAPQRLVAAAFSTAAVGKALKEIPKKTLDDLPLTKAGGQAFSNDLRGTSGLGVYDGIKNHTDKWLQGDAKSPMDYIQEAEPKLVEGPVVASRGSDDPALGAPVEYINLKGTSKEKPAVCKYTGNRYFSLPHTWNAH